MSEESDGFWSWGRELNAGFVLIGVALAAILFAAYLFRVRPVTVGDAVPSLDQVEKITAVGAFVLMVVAILVVLWQLVLMALDEGGSVGGVFKLVPAAYLIFAVSALLFIAGTYFLLTTSETIADVWRASS